MIYIQVLNTKSYTIIITAYSVWLVHAQQYIKDFKEGDTFIFIFFTILGH